MKRSSVRDNSLSIVFGILLLGTLLAQALVGLAGYNEAARTDGLAEIDLWRYVTSSSFAVDVAENWQSEYLQFTLYILLTVWLVQRGSSESKPPQDAGLGSDEQERVGRFAEPHSPSPVRRGGWWLHYGGKTGTVLKPTFSTSDTQHCGPVRPASGWPRWCGSPRHTSRTTSSCTG